MAAAEVTTEAIWITRSPTTLSHLEGLVTGLKSAGAVEVAQVTIMVVDDDHLVAVPPEFSAIGALTVDNLPPQGLLLLPVRE